MGLLEKFRINQFKAKTQPVNIADLVGEEIMIRHDSGTWEKKYIVGQEPFNEPALYERFTYNPDGTRGISVMPLDEEHELRRIDDETFLMSTPNGGGGYFLAEDSELSAAHFRDTDAYLRSIGH